MHSWSRPHETVCETESLYVSWNESVPLRADLQGFLWAQIPAKKAEKFRLCLLSCSRLVDIKRSSSLSDEDGVQVNPAALMETKRRRFVGFLLHTGVFSYSGSLWLWDERGNSKRTPVEPSWFSPCGPPASVGGVPVPPEMWSSGPRSWATHER